MAFDFKKEYKEFYLPKNKPEIVNVPTANYIAVRGKGNPNTLDGEYQHAISVLYAVAYTLKMSYKTDYKIEGFFEYVVPPLEGFWWQENVSGVDYGNKDSFNWISVIRLPDFITKTDFEWAVENASKKKKLDCSKAEFITIDETGISCRRSSNLLWSYQWEEIAQLKKGQRFLHPSVEVIVFDKQGNKEPFAGADKYFQLSKSAKTAIKKYYKG